MLFNLTHSTLTKPEKLLPLFLFTHKNLINKNKGNVLTLRLPHSALKSFFVVVFSMEASFRGKNQGTLEWTVKKYLGRTCSKESIKAFKKLPETNKRGMPLNSRSMYLFTLHFVMIKIKVRKFYLDWVCFCKC